MSTRNSGYGRVPMDLYQTREDWVIRDGLAPFVHLRGRRVWEPAAGEGHMVRVLKECGAYVIATDVKDYGIGHDYRGAFDFTLAGECPYFSGFDLIVTNPPYGTRGGAAEKFIEKGLERMVVRGSMALLLPVDFDSAKSRADFFGDCAAYVGKIVLRKRIKWFDPPAPQPGEKKRNSGPSANHAWFLWTVPVLKRRVAPITMYAPQESRAPAGAAPRGLTTMSDMRREMYPKAGSEAA